MDWLILIKLNLVYWFSYLNGRELLFIELLVTLYCCNAKYCLRTDPDLPRTACCCCRCVEETEVLSRYRHGAIILDLILGLIACSLKTLTIGWPFAGGALSRPSAPDAVSPNVLLIRRLRCLFVDNDGRVKPPRRSPWYTSCIASCPAHTGGNVGVSYNISSITSGDP